MYPGFQNRVGLARWHVPCAFFGTNPEGAWITSGLPVIRPERMLCKPDYNLDRLSGLHPSVHKPDMSVWTGSVFE
jgi:hypothetical protein